MRLMRTKLEKRAACRAVDLRRWVALAKAKDAAECVEGKGCSVRDSCYGDLRYWQEKCNTSYSF